MSSETIIPRGRRHGTRWAHARAARGASWLDSQPPESMKRVSRRQQSGWTPRPPRELWRCGRTKPGRPCPICNETDAQCIALTGDDLSGDRTYGWIHDHTYVWCIRGDRYPDLHGIHMAWGFRRDLGIWLFDLDASHQPARLPRARRQRQHPVAPPEVIDRVLRATAQILGLSDAHRQRLVAERGYDPASIGPDARHAFASLPADIARRSDVVNHLYVRSVTSDDADILGTYGFQRDRRRGGDNAPITLLPQVVGTALIELIRNEYDLITGYQYAPDIPVLDDRGKPTKRLSPARLALNGRYHVARPVDDQDTEVWYTEAIHKANRVADAHAAPALGSLGAGNINSLLAGATALDPHRERLHIVALDIDQWEGANEQNLARRLYTAGYRVVFARWEPTAGKGPDDALQAGAAISLTPLAEGQARPRQGHRRMERLTHAHPWQRSGETQLERDALLVAAAARVAEGVAAHLDVDEQAAEASGPRGVYVVAAPPGVGKSRAVAELGACSAPYPRGERVLAWIAERHDMADGPDAPDALREGYAHIRAPHAHNCPDWRLHQTLAERGYNTWPVHLAHPDGLCDYASQFVGPPRSAAFQVPHVRTPYPAQHAGIVIDELNLATWLPERQLTIGRLRGAAAQFMADSTADRLLRAMEATITQAHRDDTQLHGRALLDRLNQHCDAQLPAWLGALQHDPRATDPRPWPHIELDDSHALDHATRLHPIVLPHVWGGLVRDLPAWQRGSDYNSCLRIGPATVAGEWALHITEPLQITRNGKHALPPLVVLDATADEELLARLLDAPIHISREEITPPPHTRHIAVRTGKRYGKVSQAAGKYHVRELARTIAECRFLLDEIDPDSLERGAGRVGLITYLDCEREMAEALGISEAHSGHFWGMRGSNRLADCTILLVIGTPTLRPEEVLRMARALWQRDPDPIRDESDERVRHLAEYLSNAELTQCAHRNRPLRYDGRTVITFTAGTVDFLPITTEITSLPQLDADGTPRGERRQAEQEERLRAAARALQARGELLSASALAAAACTRKQAACAFLRKWRGDAGAGELGTIPASVPDVHITTTWKLGTDVAIARSPTAAIRASTSPDRRPMMDRALPQPAARAPAPIRPALPAWSHALELAGLGADQAEVYRIFRRLLYGLGPPTLSPPMMQEEAFTYAASSV